MASKVITNTHIHVHKMDAAFQNSIPIAALVLDAKSKAVALQVAQTQMLLVILVPAMLVHLCCMHYYCSSSRISSGGNSSFFPVSNP